MDVPGSWNNWRAALYGGAGSTARALCRQLGSSFVEFARAGDPNNGYVPHWPTFDAKRRDTMIFDTTVRAEQDPRGEIREFWADYFHADGAGSFLPG